MAAPRRRLSAILAADVVGYSRLMGASEEGTLARLNAHRRELINPKVREHRGVSSRRPAMASSWSSPVLSMRSGARSRCNAA
jgi:adenylate cyclase